MEIIANTVNKILQFIAEDISNNTLRFLYWYVVWKESN